MYRIYEVQDGETIYSIANKLDVSPEVLANINGLSPNNVLTTGSYIIIPGEDTMFDLYTIKKGDTIYAIAQKYNINPNQLLRLNGLNANEYIYPGQQLYVPKQGVSFYVTKDEDTLNNITETLGANASEIASQNATIYLVPDQLIVYKK
ncbi:MAG: LysM peptidoglycan-binding domain-containing protein [Bacilli bacterium]|nr:LysM peptidoglycan-binding domain-containing protein [Bacilli bacterium]